MGVIRSRLPARPSLAVAAAAALALGACSLNPPLSTLSGAPSPEQLAQLWIEPTNIATRDLYGGPGGAENAPDPKASYTVVDVDDEGFSRGYDVEDPLKREWSVKIGLEARPETVVSRILWAVGYHQPPTYYLPAWQASGSAEPQPAARFRLDTPGPQNAGPWKWNTNPFIGTREFQGLLVLMIMVNNWDLKDTQNVVYEAEGAVPPRQFVVRDIGGSLGGTRWFLPGSRDNLPDFERERYIERVEDGKVRFHYRGAWREPYLKSNIRVDDVIWISQWLARVSDAQWHDAFRAGGYSRDESARYIKRLKEKIADGLRLNPAGA
jgi:hypothetical protein